MVNTKTRGGFLINSNRDCDTNQQKRKVVSVHAKPPSNTTAQEDHKLYQHNITATATRTAKTLPPSFSSTLEPPLFPGVPWLNPEAPVAAAAAAPALLEPEAPAAPAALPLLLSPLVPAPETPGTDSAVAAELEAELEPVPGLSPVPLKPLSMT